MIDWKVEEVSNCHRCIANIKSLENELMKNIWCKFLFLIKKEISSYNSINVEMWPDSGRVIFYPSQLGEIQRNENFCLIVLIDDFLSQWDSLCDSDLDDSQFDNKVDEFLQRYANSIQKSLVDLVNESFGLFTRDMTVKLYNCDDLLSHFTLKKG